MTKASLDDVWIIIPCFNESSVIENTINELSEYFKKILVVNDGSTDGTEKILKNMNINYIEHPFNLGQGAAIFTGFEYLKENSKAVACITFDADGQHSVSDAIALAKEILKCQEEIIFGTRFLGFENEIPKVRRFLLKVITKITNLLSGLKLTDTHNGLKAYKIEVLDKLNTDLYGSAFETGLIFSIAKQKITYKEISTQIKYTNYSLQKGQRLRSGLIILEDLMRLGFKNGFK